MVESSISGVRINKSQNREHVLLRCKKEIDIDKFLSYCLNKVGSPYDVGAILFLGIFWSFRRMLQTNKWDASNKYMCSELISEALGQQNVVVCDKPFDLTTPEDFIASPIFDIIPCE